MVTAPAPARIIEKGLVSDRVVIDTVISKYSDHLPLYRQSVMLERETGLEISRATLDGWVMTVGGLLIPLAAAMRRELLGGRYIQADETPVDVQMHDRRGKNHQAYFWQYGRPGGSVVFDFQLGRGRDGPKRFLGSFEGLLQTDGYVAYEKVGGPKMVHVACWAHARRGCSRPMKWRPARRVAKGIVERIDDLFGIDRGGARERVRFRRASSIACRARAEVARHDQGERSRQRAAGVACQQVGQRDHLHARTMAEAHALPRIPGAGTEQQPG